MKKATRRIVMMLVAAGLVLALAACGESGGGSVKGNRNEALPEFELKSKKVTVMANWTGSESDVLELKEAALANYGIEIEIMSVGYADIPQKLTSLVITGQSPDMVLKRSDQDDFPGYIINELVQPIDEYVDITHPLFADLQDAYRLTEWDGKHYVAVSKVDTGTAAYYNKKMLEDSGMELPWDLYQRGEWDWNKLKEIAKGMKIEKDGVVEQYGFALHRPYPWAYTSGKTFGLLDSKNKTVVNNLQDADLARAMNYLSDMIINDKICPSRIDGALDLFRREQTPILIAERIYQMPEVMELAKADNLGIAPMPKDPQADVHYVRGSASGWFVPVGAKNPEGALAVISTSVFLDTGKEGKAKLNQRLKTDYGLSDENILQLETASKTGVTPVLETTPWIGYDTVWLMVGNNVNWATQVAADTPRINARIAELFEKREYDPPTGPKVVDDFESYTEEAGTALARYIPMSDGSMDMSIRLVKDDVKEGKNAVRIDYKLGTKLWGGVGRSVNKSWNGNDTMRLWLKGDGQKQTVGIQFITTGGATWTYKLELQSKEWKQYDIPLKDFNLPEYVTENTALDLTSIATFNISLGADKAQEGRIMLDKIEVVSKG